MTPPDCHYPQGTMLSVDETAQALSVDVLAGGAPLRLFRFRRGVRDLEHIASHRRVRAEDLAADTVRRLTAAGVLHPQVHSLPEVDPSLATVVIPVRDRSEHLDLILGDLSGTFSCLVVDDASLEPEKVRAVAERWGAGYHPLTANVGPGGARNAGLTLVGTPLVVFLDSDMRMEAQDLTLTLRHFCDPRIGAVAPRILTNVPVHRRSALVTALEEIEPAHDMGAAPALVGPGSRVPYVPTACLVARTDALGEGFDPELRTGEDVDLVWRLVADDWLVRYEPVVVAEHTSRPTTRAWLGQHFSYGLSASHLAARHGDDMAPARMPAWAATFDLAILALGLAAVRPAPDSVLWRRVVATACGLAAASTVVGSALTRRAVRTFDNGIDTFADRLTARTMSSALRQGIALWLRHWAPITLAGSVVSSRMRRLAVALAIADAALRGGSPLDLPGRVVARTATQFAYGLGVWVGAIGNCDWRPVVPTVPPRRG